MKKRRLSNPFNDAGGDYKSENVEEHEKKYIYPSIVNSPIMVHKDKVIYGFGNCLLVFNLKENNFIRKVEDHTCTVRSLDVNVQRKYFLTTGDDKMIMIYDDNWVLCKKIIHKKKIVKAYFLKYTNKVEEEKKIEILFIDKYGDVYVYDVSSFLSEDTESCAAVGINYIRKGNDNNESQKNDDKMIVKLSYLNDALNEIQEKDEDLFFMKDFEYVKQNYHQNVDNSKKKNHNEIEIHQKSTMNNNSDYFIQYNNINEMEKVKHKLKKHYYECFQNKKYIYPILTCNSTVISIYYDQNYLIIGDKDEKIRIIKNKKNNKIYNFYLNHTLFITSLVLINYFIFSSAGADGYLYLWNIKTRDIIDSLLLDFSFLLKNVKLNCIHTNLLPLSNNIQKFKLIITTLHFNEHTSCLYATVENLNGILIIPLILHKNSNCVAAFDKEKISFHYVKKDILSFILLRFNNENVLLYVDREEGNLHRLNFDNDNQPNGEVTTFSHSFFRGCGKMGN
ncbi:hypothetical protein POVCU1_040760 [Plasmodium ovale curtisi]|uniref:Uncharacterized protein n=1 Tax=Plasmodium ovale curtisi TaxID=864141 RepID=A0A1A8WXS5_PLAOA|nr:hypothetical protein POVCU1_040760 [Plasmodium ovale curtisi]